jgi:phage terminase small subunit
MKLDFGIMSNLRKPDRLPSPPKHLSAKAQSWWRGVVEQFELEAHHLHLLLLAAQALDAAEAARAALAAHGTVYNDRFGSPRSRPEVAHLRDSTIASVFQNIVLCQRVLDMRWGPSIDWGIMVRAI